MSVTGQLAAGSTLTITTTHPVSERAITAKVKVLAADPGTELRWVSSARDDESERRFSLRPDRRRHLAGAERDLPGDLAAAAAAP